MGQSAKTEVVGPHLSRIEVDFNGPRLRDDAEALWGEVAAVLAPMGLRLSEEKSSKHFSTPPVRRREFCQPTESTKVGADLRWDGSPKVCLGSSGPAVRVRFRCDLTQPRP